MRFFRYALATGLARGVVGTLGIECGSSPDTATDVEALEKKEDGAPLLGVGHFDSRQFSHIVTIPDVHGDAEFFIKSLWTAFEQVEPIDHGISEAVFTERITEIAETVTFPSGIPSIEQIPEPMSRLGNRVVIVQLGDIMDRGPQSLFAYQILASIETAIGWKLIQLFGNHELLLLNPSCRAAGSNCNRTVRSMDISWNNDPTDIPNTNAPLGIVDLFGWDGKLRNYILTNNLVMARIGTPIREGEYSIDRKRPDTLFVHAGLDTQWASRFLLMQRRPDDWASLIDLVNRGKREDFSTNPQISADFAWDPSSPVYVRRLSEAKIYQLPTLCSDLEQLMTRLHVSRVIVGHTPVFEHFTRVLCDDKFFITDVAMSRSMELDQTGNAAGSGQPYALVMNLKEEGAEVESLTAHYNHPNPTEHHPAATPGRTVSEVLYP